eukprot:582210-Pyramimonas_sp.AAC.1
MLALPLQGLHRDCAHVMGSYVRLLVSGVVFSSSGRNTKEGTCESAAMVSMGGQASAKRLDQAREIISMPYHIQCE